MCSTGVIAQLFHDVALGSSMHKLCLLMCLLYDAAVCWRSAQARASDIRQQVLQCPATRILNVMCWSCTYTCNNIGISITRSGCCHAGLAAFFAAAQAPTILQQLPAHIMHCASPSSSSLAVAPSWMLRCRLAPTSARLHVCTAAVTCLSKAVIQLSWWALRQCIPRNNSRCQRYMCIHHIPC
jgi:hypothetical protein